MTTCRSSILISLVAACLLPAAVAHGQSDVDKHTLAKVQSNDRYSWFTINNLFNWYANNGKGSYNLVTNNAGLEFPRGSGKTVGFEDGILWGGFHKGRAEPKIGGSTYRTGLQPGPLTGFGGPTEQQRPPAADTSLAKYRVFNVRPDVTPTTPFSAVESVMQAEADLISRSVPISAHELFDRYVQDWLDWPAKDGLPAPFKDVDGDGVYNLSKDIPGQPGADQTLYYVANDCNASLTSNLYFSPPIGLEYHKTVWGYHAPGVLDNVIFSSTLLINKSGAKVDSMFLSQWADPDLGNSVDDFMGCDIGRDLAYVYNGNSVDDVYGTRVPAFGYSLLQGPHIPSANFQDSALFRLNYRLFSRNIPMTSCLEIHGFRIDVENNYANWYAWMNGVWSFIPFLDPWSGLPTKYMYSGDPFTGQGWIDGTRGAVPGERVLFLPTGPFTLANGDSQEIVVASIVGDGADRISSISVLRHYADIARSMYRNLLDVPHPPPSPDVVAGALNGEVALTWSDSAGSVSIENWKNGGQVFEGYNVYQYDGPSAIGARAVRLATYDLRNQVTYIFDDVFDTDSRLYVSKPVQFGVDAGIKRFFQTSKDSLHNVPLRNGTTYYFGVTAYTFDKRPGIKPTQLESAPRILALVPRWEQGQRYAGNAGDTLRNVMHSGPGTGRVLAKILDPSAMPATGAQYKIVFKGTGHFDRTWDLIRTRGSLSDTVAHDQGDFTGSDDHLVIVDGIAWGVEDAPLDFKYFVTVANGSGPVVPWQQAVFAANESGFPLAPDGSSVPDGRKQQSSGKLSSNQGWIIHTGMNSPAMSPLYSNFIMRVTQANARWPLILPYDYEIRFTTRGGKALIPSAFTGVLDYIVNVPFELWNTGVATPDDSTDDYRMFPYVLDVDNSASFNLLTKVGTDSTDNGGGGSTHSISSGADDPLTDWIYWVKPTNTAPGEAGYNAAVQAAIDEINGGGDPYLTGPVSGDVMRRMVLVGLNMGAVAGGPASYAMTMPETGTIFRIMTNKQFSATDVYTITVPPADRSAEVARVDAEKVNVFPNPFIASRDPASGGIDRDVTFTHLPRRATIRIFTVSGALARSFAKDDESPFLHWDLMNTRGRVVATGVYIVHIDMPEVGLVKTLKLGVITAE
jgi:hypothetical protein